MKQLFTLIFIALMFICNGQITNKSNHNVFDILDTNEIKGLFYLKADTTLVTGRVIRYNKKRKAKKYIFVKNGVPDNLGWIYYNDNYESPKKSVLGSLVTGAAVATGAVMAISGNDIDVPLPINNANRTNHSIIQNDVKDILDYNKEIASTAYDDMSQRNEISEKLQSNKNSDIIDEPSDGLYQKKDEDGQLIIEGNYIKGIKEGLWQEYYESGRLKRKVNYNKGDIDGLWEQYHPNGQLWAKGSYKDGRIIGEWKYYDKDGKLLLTENYDK